MQPEAVREAWAWVERADADLHAVDILLAAEDAPLDIVTFHLQQAAEKLFKGALTAYKIPFPKTHDLAALIRLLPKAAGFDVHCEVWLELSYFAVVTRYPGDKQDLEKREVISWLEAVAGAGLKVTSLLGEEP